MAYHTVRQGEYLGSIATQYGFRDWHTIYEHGENLEFRKRRPNPNVIYPGDRIFIPDKQEQTVSCATGRTHIFKLNETRHFLRIILKDSEGTPMDAVEYKLEVGDETHLGTTNKDGLVYHPIPTTATTGKLTVDKMGLGWNLKIGHLDPVQEDEEDVPIITGIKARLKNLGFYHGDVDDDFGPEAQVALRRFQQTVLKRKDPDGELDRQTRLALRQEHGS